MSSGPHRGGSPTRSASGSRACGCACRLIAMRRLPRRCARSAISDLVPSPRSGGTADGIVSLLVGRERVLRPAAVLDHRPGAGYLAGAHPGPCGGITKCHPDVAQHDDRERQREPVVHEGRPRAHVVGECGAEEHDGPGAEQDEDRAECERGVQLLPGVELSDGDAARPAIAAAQPLPVRGREPVQASGVSAKRLRQQSQGKRNEHDPPSHLMDHTDRSTIAHDSAEPREVEEGGGDHEHAEQHAERSMHPALAAAEATQHSAGRRGVRRWGHRTVRSRRRPMHPRRSRAVPSTPVAPPP